MPNKKHYQAQKQAKINEFIQMLNISATDAELLYSITKESGHNATRPIINYRLKRFAIKRHKTFKHIQRIYRCFLEYSAQELKRPIIKALLIRKSNKNNLIMQEVELIDTIESYKSLLKINALIGKEKGRIKDIKINFYYDDIEANINENTKDIVLIEQYGNHYKKCVVIVKRNELTNDNETLQYEDISAILKAKERQLINNNLIDALIINEL